MKPEADGYIPFTQRLAAWWHGEPVGARLVKGKSENKTDIAIEEPVDTSRWSKLGVNICGRLWGPGFSEPGGAAMWEDVVVPANPNAAMTVLAFCPGLAGGLRHLSRRFDLWLTALDDDREVMDAAQDLNEQAGMHQRVVINPVDFAEIELPEKTKDLVFAREAFYRIADKPRLFSRIIASLKPGGHLVFTDLVVSAEDRGSPEIAAWLEVEPGGQHAWSEEQYRGALEGGPMDVYIINDESAHYNELILQGWQSLQDSLVQDPNVSRTFVDVLMREAQIWLARSRALQSGKLRLIRVHARRRKLRRTSQQ